MRSLIQILLSLIVSLLLYGCSDDNSNDSKEVKVDHVWKEQTDTINKAREVEGMIMDSADATKQAIDKQTE